MSWYNIFMSIVTLGILLMAFCGLAGFSPKRFRKGRRADVGGSPGSYDGGGDGGGGGD